MISKFYGQERFAEQLRTKTDVVLSEMPLPDENGLLADLAAVGYLRERPLGCAAALMLCVNEEAELFVDDMPDQEDLMFNGATACYESPHMILLGLKTAVSNAMPGEEYAPSQPGYVIDMATGKHKGRQFVPKDALAYERLGDNATSALQERGVNGAVNSNEIVDRERYRSPVLRSITEVLRMAAQWKRNTMKPPYNFLTGEDFSRNLTTFEARRALGLQLDSLEFKQPRNDIDIVFEVTGLKR